MIILKKIQCSFLIICMMVVINFPAVAEEKTEIANKTAENDTAKAEEPVAKGKMSFTELKDYLLQLKNRSISPMDAYIEIDGDKRMTLREIAKGRPIILHFWATWCGPCVQEMPSLERLAVDLKDKNVVVIALSEDFEGIEKVKEFFRSRDIKQLTPYADIGNGMGNIFEVYGLPTTFFLDSEGDTVKDIGGPMRWEDPMIRKIIDIFIEDYGAKPNAEEKQAQDKPAVSTETEVHGKKE